MVLYGPIVENLIRYSKIRVACSPEDESLVVAWACVDKRQDVVHYCWTRELYRHNGVMSSLLADIDSHAVEYSHETLQWRRYVAQHFPRWVYRPEIIR